ncbi:hypothetical protein MJN69_27035, partial [Salmonella enterica subsp. enterica serovar Kentucky]|nr:hypothetical protein [Salmonella enterica subsp. enterica serovar Kentucky]
MNDDSFTGTGCHCGLKGHLYTVGTGNVALGVGIWAMHFVGMLAMDHAMNMRFDPFLTGLSMLIAIGSSL